jgi:CheY-like chemotaxis protein
MSLSMVLALEAAEDFIVLATGESNESVYKIVEKYDNVVQNDNTLKQLQAEELFKPIIKEFQNIYLLNIGPFKHSEVLTLTYLKLKSHFPTSFIFDGKEEAQTKTLFVDKPVYIKKEDPVLWIALFGLGIIGIFALYLSSDQIKHIKQKHAKMQKKQNETVKRQHIILAKMGEEIQNAVKQNLQSEENILEMNLKNRGFKELRDRIENMKKYDDALLHSTYEMIDFLKIKSGTIVLRQEPFQLSMLLHKLTNAISESLKVNHDALYFDVKKSVSRYLVGDALRIFQVLYNVLSCALEENNKNSKIILSMYVENQKIIFKIINENQYLDPEAIESLFVPNSWEELQKTNKELSFFVTNELISQMNGLFSIKSDQENGTVYTCSLPYIKDKEERSNKENLKEILVDKKVLIIDDDTLNMEILKYILSTYTLNVERQMLDHFKQYKPQNPDWDIVVLNAKDITPMHLEFFHNMRQENGLKVILIHEIFEAEDLVDIALQITDAELYSPIIPGDVEELLYKLFIVERDKQRAKNNMLAKPYQHDRRTMRITESPDVSREDFKRFAGKNVLIAEDNFVNQKVMSGILSASNIHVHKAENGKQALEILEDHDIDLILMDMSMPVMDGFDATRRIKRDMNFKDIPVVAVTGLGFNHELERMGRVGVDACITKPFKIGQLYTAMEEYLGYEEEIHAIDEIDRYIPDEKILSIKRGISNVHNEVFYKEVLSDVGELLEKSNKHFVLMIEGADKEELQAFCRNTLSLVETIGATRLTQIFKEILVFISSKKEVSLEVYSSLYQKEWNKLKREMELYLKC